MGNLFSCYSADEKRPKENESGPKLRSPANKHALRVEVATASVAGTGITYETNTIAEYIDDEGNTRINQYIILEALGQGSTAVVKRVLNTQNDKYYAMKIFSKASLTKKNIGRRKSLTTPLMQVLREVAVMKKLLHPNVVNLIEVLDDRERNSLNLVMDLVDNGCILPGKAPFTPLPEEECRRYFRQMILGLEYLHSQNIIHRDIKPENILLSKNNNVKLSDFGMSFPFENDDDNVATTAGTAAFMAPEMCSADGDPFSGKAVDIWALGVTLYVCLVGTVPFGNPDGGSWDIYEAILKHPLKIPENISSACQDVIRRLLEKDSKKRIDMETLRAHPWVTRCGMDVLAEQACCKRRMSIHDDEATLAITPVSKLASLVSRVQMKQRLKNHLSKARSSIAARSSNSPSSKQFLKSDSETDLHTEEHTSVSANYSADKLAIPAQKYTPGNNVLAQLETANNKTDPPIEA